MLAGPLASAARGARRAARRARAAGRRRRPARDRRRAGRAAATCCSARSGRSSAGASPRSTRRSPPARSTSTRPASRRSSGACSRSTTPPARRAGATLLPAMGYDFVPGALAGALALEEAGARRGPRRRRLLRARRRPGVAEPRHPRLAGGRRARPRVRVPRRAASRARAPPSASAPSPCAGKDRPAISVGGAEHFTLPAAYPRLREVNVYLGWFGPASRASPGARARARR